MVGLGVGLTGEEWGEGVGGREAESAGFLGRWEGRV